MNFIIGAVITLHALVHFWFIALALRLLEYKPEFGWTTRSWLFTSLLGDEITRKFAAVLLFIVMGAMAVGGVAFIFSAGWARPLLIASAAASILVLVLFWDGSFAGIVQKGLVAFLLDAAIILGMVFLP
jgi:hypothetical protein